jgi:hypothetical protein
MEETKVKLEPPMIPPKKCLLSPSEKDRAKLPPQELMWKVLRNQYQLHKPVTSPKEKFPELFLEH